MDFTTALDGDIMNPLMKVLPVDSSVKLASTCKGAYQRYRQPGLRELVSHYIHKSAFRNTCEGPGYKILADMIDGAGIHIPILDRYIERIPSGTNLPRSLCGLAIIYSGNYHRHYGGGLLKMRRDLEWHRFINVICRYATDIIISTIKDPDVKYIRLCPFVITTIFRLNIKRGRDRSEHFGRLNLPFMRMIMGHISPITLERLSKEESEGERIDYGYEAEVLANMEICGLYNFGFIDTVVMGKRDRLSYIFDSLGAGEYYQPNL